MIRDVLKMGDERLLAISKPVEKFDTPELHALLADMHETMAHLDGAGLAAPQIGVGLRVVVFGVTSNPRYPDAEAVPYTVLINPVIEPLSGETEEGWEGCLSVPGLRGVVPRYSRLRYRGFDAAELGARMFQASPSPADTATPTDRAALTAVLREIAEGELIRALPPKR